MGWEDVASTVYVFPAGKGSVQSIAGGDGSTPAADSRGSPSGAAFFSLEPVAGRDGVGAPFKPGV